MHRMAAGPGKGGVMASKTDQQSDQDRGRTADRTQTTVSRARFSALMAVFLGTVLATLPMPAHADEPSGLQGAWVCDEEGTRSRLEFLSGSQLSYDGETTTYTLLEDVIVVDEEYGAVPYFYGFEGDSLVIASPDGTVTWCTRATQPTPSLAARVQAPDTDGAGPGALVPGPDWPVYEQPAEPLSEDAPSPQALLYKFAGRWDHVTANTVTNVYLHPDSTYESSYEAGYSGQFEDQGGYQTGSWGATGTEDDRGHWMIEGSLREGTLTLIAANGDRASYHYQVHVEDGEVYWGEYLFDGDLYQVTYLYR